MFRAALLLAALAHAPLEAQITWSSDGAQPRPQADDSYRMVATPSGLILFGGAPRAETWRYRSGTWTLLQTAHSPSARREFAMAYDSNRNLVVLFGGLVAPTGLTDDTWTFDGTDWTRRNPANQPPPRRRSAMAHHPQTRRTVLFGGSDSALQLLNDTWTWDGSNWQEAQPTVHPSRRERHAMAYIPAFGRVVLFGGADASGVLDQTWMYASGRWVRHVSSTLPPGRVRHSLTHFVGRNRVVLHGGSVDDQNLLSDTWEFGLSGWIETTPATPGPTVRDHASAFEAATGEVVIFGGAEPRTTPSGTQVPTPSDQFHRYAVTARGRFDQITTSFCAGVSSLCSLREPLVGSPEFRLILDTAPSSLARPFVAFLSPGFSATPARLGPCDLHLTGVLTAVPSDVSFGGTFPVPIPNDRTLAGAQVYVQAVGPANGPRNGFQGFGLSPTYRITVGD